MCLNGAGTDNNNYNFGVKLGKLVVSGLSIARQLDDATNIACNDRSPEVYDDFFVKEPIIDLIVYGRSIGSTRLQQVYQTWFDAFPDLIWGTSEVITSANSVIITGTQSMTHQCKFMGINPTGKKISFKSSVILSKNSDHDTNGKITNMYGSIDIHSILSQMGTENIANLIPINTWYNKVTTVSNKLSAISYYEPLTLREIECLCLYLSGKSAQDIEKILGLAINRANIHLGRILMKCNCNSQHDLFNLVHNLGAMHFVYDLNNLLANEPT